MLIVEIAERNTESKKLMKSKAYRKNKKALISQGFFVSLNENLLASPRGFEPLYSP
jgi:hypothetical protein